MSWTDGVGVADVGVVAVDVAGGSRGVGVVAADVADGSRGVGVVADVAGGSRGVGVVAVDVADGRRGVGVVAVDVADVAWRMALAWKREGCCHKVQGHSK